MTSRRVDASNEAEVEAAVADCVDRHGGIDIVVDSAAVHPYGTIVSSETSAWERRMAVNVGSIDLTGRFCIPHVVRRGGGAIVTVSSDQGRDRQADVAAYVATKGAIHALTRAMALDHAGAGVRVNSVSPGSVRTPILPLAVRTYAVDGVSEEEAFAPFGAAHPIGPCSSRVRTSASMAG